MINSMHFEQTPIKWCSYSNQCVSTATLTSILLKTIDYQLKTTQSEISFTNVGGSLHNIDFIRNKDFPITDVLSVTGFGQAHYSGKKIDSKTIELVYRDKDWQKQALKITGGKGVDVVYDSVGLINSSIKRISN